MEPIKRNANRMLDTLTGKIPEKLSQENSFEPLPTLQEMDSANSSSSSSFFDSIKNNWAAILAGLLLVMFTVFNVLAYYLKEKGEATETTKKMFKSFDDANKYINDSFTKVKDYFSGEKREKKKEKEEVVVANDEGEGTEEPITTSNPVVATALSNQLPNITSGEPIGKPIVKNEIRRNIAQNVDDGEWEEEENEHPNAAINALDTALSNASQKKDDNSTYKANDAYSSVQTVKAKAGWCFVGEERGFRNCVEVGENDKCLSGDIFPTNAVCVNPRLRA
jgi:hypothetical protein